MTERVIRVVVDDLDGSTIAPDAGERLTFALRGREYRIDLSDKNVAKLDAALEPFIDVAAQIGGPRRRRKKARDQEPGVRRLPIREWARENGYWCSSRGRLRSDIIQAYENANDEHGEIVSTPGAPLPANADGHARQVHVTRGTLSSMTPAHV